MIKSDQIKAPRRLSYITATGLLSGAECLELEGKDQKVIIISPIMAPPWHVSTILNQISSLIVYLIKLKEYAHQSILKGMYILNSSHRAQNPQGDIIKSNINETNGKSKLINSILLKPLGSLRDWLEASKLNKIKFLICARLNSHFAAS